LNARWLELSRVTWWNGSDYAVHWHIFIYLLLKLIRSRWWLATSSTRKFIRYNFVHDKYITSYLFKYRENAIARNFCIIINENSLTKEDYNWITISINKLLSDTIEIFCVCNSISLSPVNSIRQLDNFAENAILRCLDLKFKSVMFWATHWAIKTCNCW